MSTFAAANRKCDAPVAQLVEHLTLNQGVQGSSPCGCTTLKTISNNKSAPVAQLVEHLTLNQGVQGSSPCGCTKLRGEQKFTSFVVMFGTSII